MLRATGTPVAIPDWSWQIRDMGQQLFWPPSVAGWEWGALDAVGRPWASNATRGRLLDLARRYADLGAARGQDRTAADMTQRALRHLLLAGPDNQLH